MMFQGSKSVNPNPTPIKTSGTNQGNSLAKTQLLNGGEDEIMYNVYCGSIR